MISNKAESEVGKGFEGLRCLIVTVPTAKQKRVKKAKILIVQPVVNGELRQDLMFKAVFTKPNFRN